MPERIQNETPSFVEKFGYQPMKTGTTHRWVSTRPNSEEVRKPLSSNFLSMGSSSYFDQVQAFLRKQRLLEQVDGQTYPVTDAEISAAMDEASPMVRSVIERLKLERDFERIQRRSTTSYDYAGFQRYMADVDFASFESALMNNYWNGSLPDIYLPPYDADKEYKVAWSVYEELGVIEPSRRLKRVLDAERPDSLDRSYVDDVEDMEDTSDD